jgi:16S rRNA (uracil1498-N3)-methyltransferase
MHRFYLSPDQCQALSLALTEHEACHAAQVLRIMRGERVLVLDGAGQTLDCAVTEVSRRLVRLEVIERRRIPPSPCQITLLQAIPKGKGFDEIIQKATELGVFRLVPLITERVVVRLSGEDIKVRAAKWRQTSLEAIKQCGNAWLPVVEAPLRLRSFLDRREPCDLALVASLVDEPRHIRERFRQFLQRHQRLPRTIHLWIGPEGDFTPAEVEMVKESGALPISLGGLVLRCETAAICGLSVLNHELSGSL